MLLNSQVFRSVLFLYVCIFTITVAGAQTLENNPLTPADTSSPRATLQSFISAVDDGLDVELASMLSYLASDRLYPSEFENQLIKEADIDFFRALETLDLSGLPSGFRDVLAIEQAIRLIEILSRLDLPDFESIPDHEDMKISGEKRWVIPDTRIEIGLVEEGPRSGEYLFSASTVAHLGKMYERIAALPYKPGSMQRYVEAIGPYSSATTLYDIYRNSTPGFGVLPGRWGLSAPTWLTTHIGGIALWQILGLTIYLLLAALSILLVRFICHKAGVSAQWRWFFTSVVVVIFSKLMVPLCGQLHISGNILYVIGITSVAVLFIVAAWAMFVGAGAVAETVIRVQQRRDGAIDSQLIRLGARLTGLIIAVILLLEGADEMGFPAYSVLAGLGISGLAVALAARETLANLLGSIVIMIEKPFRNGHWIKVGDAEGTVEHVGFRSTRIRTFGDSLISIPNSVVVNSVVDNFGLRGRRRQRFFIQVTYNTSREKVEAFVAGIREIITDHPITDKDDAYIHFNNLGESGLEILLYFHLRASDYTTELRERELILLRIMTLAEDLGVAFAYPTRTLHIDHASEPEKITPIDGT
jgi:MscS family membrane protein